MFLVLDVLSQNLEPVDFAASREAIAARVLSLASAISRAEPAVSAPITLLRPSLRMTLRHWPSAWIWLCTVSIVESVAPFGAMSWWRIGEKYSAMMCRPDVGIRW